MDIPLSIATGLALRLLLSSLDTSLGRLGPVLVGLWEGVAVHHLSNSSLLLDHYLAFALRVAVDFYFTSNVLREIITFLFTILGLVASETLKPTRPRRVHHRRSFRPSVPTRIPHYISEPLAASSTPIHPSHPPTPPSIFLEGGSDSNLTHSDNLTRTSTENNEELSISKHAPLPTPPYTLVSEVRDSHVVDRLSTIEEQSSGEEGTRRSVLGAVLGTLEASQVHSYGPSMATPLPVPNLTIQHSRASVMASMKPSPPPEAPLPIPNASTKYYVNEDDDSDPLQTPPPAGSPHWHLVLTDDDGLTTPPARELSPLVLEPTLLPSFGQILASTEASVLNSSSTPATTEVVAAQPVSSAVEYPSTPVAPLLRDSDPAPGPALDTRPEEAQTEPKARPELDSTLHTRHDHNQQVQHEIDDHSAFNGIWIKDAGQDTETETDAASMISSHPAAIMYSRAEALRDEARAAEAEHIRLKKELQHVQGVKMLFLKQQIKEQEDLARRLHVKAAKRFFKARNDLRKRHPHEVDVHGLRVAEAVHQTEQALRDAYTDQVPSIRVIVGKGLHSAGKPVLKEAISRIMEKHGIPCRVDPKNTGVLIMTLPTS